MFRRFFVLCQAFATFLLLLFFVPANAETSIVIENAANDNLSRGSMDAPVIVVEFSDYRCPYCKRFHQEAFAEISDKLILTGKVRYTFVEFPQPKHSFAKAAAEAAQCAARQQKFFEARSYLFNNSEEIDGELIKRLAENIGLETEEYAKCLNTGVQLKEIDRGIAAAKSLGIPAVPSILLFQKSDQVEPTELLVGNQKAEKIIEVVNSLIDRGD